MKTSRIVFCLILGIIYTACNDTIGRVGLDMMPGDKIVNVFDTTVFVSAKTVEVDSIYAKTTNGFLGEFYDPSYGNIKSSYICQYYPSVGFPYLDSIVGGKIDSVRLNIYYSTVIGDTLAPMEVTVYPVNKLLDKNYYTNSNPEDFCDMNNPFAKYSFTARNMNISDSLLQVWQTNYGYYSYISIPLPVKIGQDYLDSLMAKKQTTMGLDDFLNFFPGTYLKTTYGAGCMLPIDMTQIFLYYTRLTSTLTDSNGNNDSTGYVVSSAAFTVTKEIIQLNKFENTNPAFLLQDDTAKTYLKTPAGVFTELTIPIKQIVQGIGKMKFSSVALSLKAYPASDWNYSLQFPGSASSMVPTLSSDGTIGASAKLLLIEPDSVANFFENTKVADGQTTFTTQLNASTYTYDFPNISNLIQSAINKAPDQDLRLWVIPVQTTWVQSTSIYGSAVSADYMTSHYLYPSGVTLMKGGDNLKVRVIATDLTFDK